MLAPARLDFFGVGWDNLAFLVNERFVFRFPRRRIAAGLIEREIRVLPRLAPHLPLPIPAPLFAGKSEAAYPYAFAGYPRILGTTACQPDLSEAERARNVAPLARFLAQLHQIPVDEQTRAEGHGDDIERANIGKHAPHVQERLRGLAPQLDGVDVDALLARLDRLAVTPPRAEPSCWVHGDLYARHLLLDDDRCLCGVIDWGDVHLGDPALDLSIAFSFLPPTARDTFRQVYGPIDEATWVRAQFRAIHYGTVLISYGTDVGDAAIRAVGAYALRTALD